MAILRQYILPDVLSDGYTFTKSGTYRPPHGGTLQGVQDYVGGLPPSEDPEVFGMHANANITF